ncbi:MAG: hypothetical protein KA152_16935 [Verrucomicrobiales bacterium]|nr:hypothetical protein [Verrucomicrobiales bacterium]
MTRLPLAALLLAIATLIPACTTPDASDNDFSVGGIPKWLAEGAKIDDEPAPLKPDPAIMHHKSEGGPVSFEFITDNRKYHAPKQKMSVKPARHADPIERGREQRIKRLFR